MDLINFILMLGLLITFVSAEQELFPFQIGFGILDPRFAERDKISQMNRQNHIIEGRPAVKKSIPRPANKRIQPVIMKTGSKSVPQIDASKDTTPNDNSKTLPIISRYNKKGKLIKIIREPYQNRIVLKSKFEEDTDKSHPSDIYVHKKHNNDSTVNAKNMNENNVKNSTIVADNKIDKDLHLTESPEKGTNKSDTQLESKSKEDDKIKSSDTDKTKSPRVTFKNIIDMYRIENVPKKKMEHSRKIHNQVIPEVLTAKTNNHYAVKYDETSQKKTSSFENETQQMQPKVIFEEDFGQLEVDNSLNNTFSIPQSHGSELNLDIIQNENLNFENVLHENKLKTDLPSQYLTESDLFNESVPQPTDGHLIIDGRMNPLQNYNHMDGSLDKPIENRIKIDIVKEEEINQDTVSINSIDRIVNDENINLSENNYHYQDESKDETPFSSVSLSQYYPSMQTGRFKGPIRFTISGTPTMNCAGKPFYINQFSRNFPNFGILRNYFNQEYNPYGRIWRSWKSSEIIIGNLKNANELINLNKFILNSNNGRNICKYRKYKYPVVIGY